MNKIYWFALAPIYYHTPIYRAISKSKHLDLTVFYFETYGVESVPDPDFGLRERKWDDVDLFSGYKYYFLKNYAKSKSLSGFFSLANWGIFSAIRKSRPDIVVIQSYATFSDWIAFFAAKMYGCKIIWRGEANLYSEDRRTILSVVIKVIKRLVLQLLFNSCDVIFYSCSGNNLFLIHYGALPKKLIELRCAVDNDYFRLEHAKNLAHLTSIRNSLNIDDTDFVIAQSGKLTVRKCPTDLIRAISHIPLRGNIVALFIGDGPERSKIEELAMELDVRVVVTGYVGQSNIAKYYSISDSYAILSDRDYSPKALNEAMNFSLPIICTDCIGTAVDLVSPANGFLVRNGDTRAIANAINFLKLNPEQRREMGLESLRVVQHWSFDQNANAFNKALDYINEKK